MSVLRVLLADAPSPTGDAPWAMYDDDGRHARSGFGEPSSWPAAQRKEAVLAASAIRLAGVALPPMPADRVAGAAAFALEDQLAGPAQAQHLVAFPRRRDGIVDVAIAARALFGPLRATFERVVAEPAAAPVPAAGIWRWYASGLDGGFVRKPDGSAFAVSAPGSAAPVPAELALALKQSARPGIAVEVAFAADDAQLAAWSAQCGVAFRRVPVWHWDRDGAALTAATDLLQGEFARETATPVRTFGNRLRFAAGLAVAAVALHVIATLAQWTWLRIETWRNASALVALARDDVVTELGVCRLAERKGQDGNQENAHGITS